MGLWPITPHTLALGPLSSLNNLNRSLRIYRNRNRNRNCYPNVNVSLGRSRRRNHTISPTLVLTSLPPPPKPTLYNTGTSSDAGHPHHQPESNNLQVRLRPFYLLFVSLTQKADQGGSSTPSGIPFFSSTEGTPVQRMEAIVQEALALLGVRRDGRVPRLQREEVFRQDKSLGDEIRRILQIYEGGTPFDDWNTRVKFSGPTLAAYNKVFNSMRKEDQFVMWVSAFRIVSTPQGLRFFQSLLDRGAVFWYLGLCMAVAEVDNLATGLMLDPSPGFRTLMEDTLHQSFDYSQDILSTTGLHLGLNDLQRHQFLPYCKSPGHLRM